MPVGLAVGVGFALMVRHVPFHRIHIANPGQSPVLVEVEHARQVRDLIVSARAELTP